MGKETELKLRVSAPTLAALRAHPLLKKRNKSGWQSHQLRNQYFDTPEHALAAAQVALRLREDDGELTQTLKTSGNSLAGLSERGEWNWPLKKNRLDLKRLSGDCWPQALAGLDTARLQAVLSTDFQREQAQIAWGRGKAKTVVEVALDQGQISAADQHEALCELELELCEGEPAALLELAIELASELPLLPCDISKAERGYRLLHAARPAALPAAPALSAEQSLDDSFASLLGQLLGNSQQLAEQYLHYGHWKLLEQWLLQLVELRALLGSLGQAAPRTSSSVLRAGLDALLADWRPRLLAGRDDESLRQAAPALFANELQGNRWGLLSLQLAHWLLTRGWCAGRTARGQRQGAAMLGNWLSTQLAEEARALRLDHYQQHPEALTEQLPRIERIQAWLHLARQVLELPELDRLYGELAILQALTEQTADAEQLASRQAQAHTVATLKPWKLLCR